MRTTITQKEYTIIFKNWQHMSYMYDLSAFVALLCFTLLDQLPSIVVFIYGVLILTRYIFEAVYFTRKANEVKKK